MLRLTNLRVPLDMASGSLRPLLEKKLSLHIWNQPLHLSMNAQEL